MNSRFRIAKQTLVFSFILFFGVARAQDVQYSQYYAAPLFLNPALTGMTQEGRVGLNYRSQWPNLAAGFKSFSFYFDYNLGKPSNTSLGLIFTNDNAADILKSNRLGIQYAYQLKVNEEWYARVGIEGAFGSKRLDYSNLIFGDQLGNAGLINPVSVDQGENVSIGYFDISFGFIIMNKNLWMGGSAHHLNTPNQSLTGGRVPLPTKLSFHGGYRISLSEDENTDLGKRKFITPSFNFKKQNAFSQLDLGAYFTVNNILAGLWYRGLPIAQKEGVINNESLVIMLGVQANDLTFGYSFDYTVSRIGVASVGGAHEFSLSYNFSLADPRLPPKHMRYLDCPIPFQSLDYNY